MEMVPHGSLSVNVSSAIAYICYVLLSRMVVGGLYM